jgi:hypothetical protein
MQNTNWHESGLNGFVFIRADSWLSFFPRRGDVRYPAIFSSNRYSPLRMTTAVSPTRSMVKQATLSPSW